MLIKLIFFALAGLSAVGAVNYEPPSQGNVLQVLCPDSSTLQFKLNASTASVYAAYVASQNSWPATMFFVNNATTATDTQCSPPQTFAAFQINAAGSLDADGTTYNITDFVQLSAADAATAVHKKMQQALIPDEDESFWDLQNVYNGAADAGLDQAYTQAMQIPDGYMEAIWAMGNITQALTADTTGSQSLSIRGPELVFGFISGAAPVLVAIGVIFIAIELFSAKATYNVGGAGKITQLEYPSTYILPWFVMGGVNGGDGGDSDDPATETCDATNPPGFDNPPSSIEVPHDGPCKIFIKDLQIKRPSTGWTFINSLGVVTTDHGYSEIDGTLVMICEAPDSSTEGSALTGEFKQTIFTTESEDADGGAEDEGDTDEDCDPFADTDPDLPTVKVVPYLNIELDETYNVIGSGEIDMEFVIHFPSANASFNNVAIMSDGSNPDDNNGITTVPLQTSEPCMEITRLAANVSSLTASMEFSLGLGVKTIVNKKEILDIGLTAGPQIEISGSNFDINIESTSNSTATTEAAQATSVETVKTRRFGKVRRAEAASDNMYNPASTESTAQGCHEELSVTAGFETVAIVKFNEKEVLHNEVEGYTDIPVETSQVVKCEAPWVVG